MPRKLTSAECDQVLQILAESESITAARESCGIAFDRPIPERMLRDVCHRLTGKPPSQLVGQAVVPNGHRVRGNSTLADGDGNVSLQWRKTERDSADPPRHEPVPSGHAVSKVSTLLDATGKVRAQWIQSPKAEATRLEEFWLAHNASAAEYVVPVRPTRAAPLSDADLCTVYALGDPHIGMLSWGAETGADFDLAIAVRDLYAAVDLLVDGAPRSAVGLLANLGDFFHAESDKQVTPTGGNKLDVDSRWAKIARAGLACMRRMIDRMLQKHDRVVVVNVPGNHDPQMARMLNIWLEALYEREPRVQMLPNFSPFIYYRHGSTLLGFAHGDGGKIEQLPAVMAADQAELWGQTEFRFWHTGHEHHLRSKEFPGCVIHTWRTLASNDAWHHWKRYRSGKSLSCITYHREFGERVRGTVELKLVRAERE